jgi:outer membrane protein OmpA-like peptidoglycan-associated protein
MVFAVVMLAVLAALPAVAQDGKLKIKVTPKEAYVFIDGNAMGDGSHSYRLSPGSHQVAVHNYGYRPKTQSVDITAGQTTRLEVSLEPVGGPVSGPWGRIQIEGGGHHVVLLNGKNPDYMVGHADEFNHDIIWKQELIVPAGPHHVTLIRDGRTTYETDVDVAANQRVIINAKSGATRNTDWPRGGKLSNLPRFKAGIASATVAVAPVVIDSFTATPPRILCEDSSRLAWQTTDAVEVWLDDNKVDLDGEQLVTPLKPTTYNLTAAGPGGRKQQSVNVDVIIEVQASLSVEPPEIRYRSVGTRVIEHGTATVTWSTSNATTVTLDPFGPVSASGNRTVQPAPRQTTYGPVNETVTYTLNASNKCGGSATRAADLRITGIKLPPLSEVHVESVFFPTDYPDERNPNLGLLRSERGKLQQLVGELKVYVDNDPDMRIKLEGHADPRHNETYNQELGSRRANIVKQFLVDQGVPSARIEATSYGETRNLTSTEVEGLLTKTGCPDEFYKPRNREVTSLAVNRRVDLVLAPDGSSSERYYSCPDSKEWRILWQRAKPSRSLIEKNQ